LIENKEPGDDYTRAGRTDRGVSSFGNVISLNLRTSIPKGTSEINTIDHCRIINANLPSDIRVLSCQ
jgi:tRNA pseudouridine38/39 synthase